MVASAQEIKSQLLSSINQQFIDVVGPIGNLLIDDAEMAERRAEQDKKGWKPVEARPRKVTTALKAYALLATSADKGAVRDKALLDKLVP